MPTIGEWCLTVWEKLKRWGFQDCGCCLLGHVMPMGCITHPRVVVPLYGSREHVWYCSTGYRAPHLVVGAVVTTGDKPLGSNRYILGELPSW